mmetsp:Transcript_620/g.1486  ORF Transcript_620/g.1486 Transcript_620/m.1486 type:complete len:213 (-) Transcript_620:182-820(-)
MRRRTPPRTLRTPPARTSHTAATPRTVQATATLRSPIPMGRFRARLRALVTARMQLVTGKAGTGILLIMLKGRRRVLIVHQPQLDTPPQARRLALLQTTLGKQLRQVMARHKGTTRTMDTTTGTTRTLTEHGCYPSEKYGTSGFYTILRTMLATFEHTISSPNRYCAQIHLSMIRSFVPITLSGAYTYPGSFPCIHTCTNAMYLNTGGRAGA